MPWNIYGQESSKDIQSDVDFLTLSSDWKELDVEINSWWILEDDMGFIWFNSAEGLCRFDGNQFYYFKHDPQVDNSIPNGFITAIAFKNAEQVWIGFRRLGLFLYDLKTEKTLKSFSYTDTDKEGLSSNSISSMVLDRNKNLWVLTADNILHLHEEASGSFKHFPISKPTKFKTEQTDSSPGRIIQDRYRGNVLWIGSRFGLYQFDITSGRFILHEIDNFVNPIGYQFSTPIYQDEKGLIWYGHFRNEGVKIFDPALGRWIEKIPIPDSISSFTYDIKPYGDSLIIASLRPDHFIAIEKYNPEKYSIVASNHSVAKFSCLAIDKNQSLYSTSPTGKLTKLSRYRSRFETTALTYPDGSQFFPWTMVFDSVHHKYYISDKGKGSFSIFSSDFSFIKTILLDGAGETNIHINAFYIDENSETVYIASSKGLYAYKTTDNVVRRRLSETPLAYESFEKLKFHNGKLWLIQNRSLVVYDPVQDNYEKIEITDIHNASTRIKDFVFLKNQNIFISTTSGLLLYNRLQKTSLKYEIVDASIDLTKTMYCNSLIRVEDTIWLGTLHNGIFKLVQKDRLSFSAKNYYNANSTLANSFQSITLTDNEIWGATSSGFTVLDIEKEDFINYVKTDGIQRGYRKMLFYNGAEGTLISPYHDGFYQFDPTLINADQVAPYLVKVKVNNEDVDLKSLTGSENSYRFTYDQKDLFFELGAQNFGVENTTFYRYRLLGYDDEWNYSEDNNSINFVNLPVGNYVLEYDARSFHSYWNEEPSRLSFEIKSHLLWTPFFKLVWLLIGGLLIAAIFRKYRNDRDKRERLLDLQKKRAESELKALKAQMNPHFLFNTLNSINWYIIKNRPAAASKYLTKFSKLMRLILDNSKKELISLGREIETLKLYTEMEEVRFEGEFNYDYNINPGIDAERLMMPPLIFQPFIENAIWHGLVHKKEKGKISLNITEESGQLKCVIEDDGIGRASSQVIKSKGSNYHESSGIEITRQRIEGIKTTDRNVFLITDLVDDDGNATGTKIEIFLPIIYLSGTAV